MIRIVTYLIILCLCIQSNAQNTNLRYPGEGRLIVFPVIDTMALLNQVEQVRRLTLSDPDSALVLSNDLLLKSQRSGYATGIILSRLCSGKIYAIMGQYTEARSVWNQGIRDIYTYGQGHTWLASFYSNIAVLLALKGAYKQSLSHLYHSLYFVKAFSPQGPQATAVYNNISSVLYRIPGVRPDGPMYYLDLAMQNAHTRKDTVMLAGIWSNRGSVYVQQKDWKMARIYFDSALAVTPSPALMETRYSTLLSMGGWYLAQNNYAKALTSLQEAKAIEKNIRINPYYRALTNMRLAEIYIRNKDAGKAMEYINQARILAEQLQLDAYRSNIYESISRIYEQMGAYQKALYYQRYYYRLNDSIYQQQSVEHIREMDIKYRTIEKEKEITAGQLLISRQQNRLHSKNILLWAGLLCSLLLGVLLLAVYKNARHKHRIMLKDRSIADLKAMMKGEEKERMRIAGELHDGIGGMLTAINMSFNSLATAYPDKEKKQVEHINQMLQSTYGEVRSVAQNLMPDSVIRFGFQKALQTYCNTISTYALGTDIYLKFYGNLSFNDKSVELMLYRICQELIQNVIKHAQATKIEIQVMEYEQRVNITVEDNGIGFNTAAEHQGIGLQNLRFRIQMLQGFLSLTSAPGRGTTVHIEFDKNTFN